MDAADEIRDEKLRDGSREIQGRKPTTPPPDWEQGPPPPAEWDLGINFDNLDNEFTVADELALNLLTPQTGSVNIIPHGLKVGQAFTLNELLKQTKFKYGIQSPTGSGKTWLLLNMDCVVIFVPYRNLARSIANEHPGVACVIGGEDIPDDFTKFVAVYDCADKLRSYLHKNDEYDDEFWDKLVVAVDESHQLVYSANFRRPAINGVINFASRAFRVIDSSATRLTLTPGFEDSEVIKFEREVAHERSLFCGTIGNSAKAIDQILTIGQAKNERPVVVLLQNSKNENELTKRQIEPLGWRAIHFNADQKNIPDYEEMLMTQRVPEWCDVILATCLWQDGHNLFSEIELNYGGRPVVLIVRGDFGVVQIEQADSRIRDALRIETILDMDFDAHEMTLNVYGENIILTGDQEIDIPDIVTVLRHHAEKGFDFISSIVKNIKEKYAGDDLKDMRSKIMKQFLFEAGYMLVKTERGEELRIDELGIRHNAQIHFDKACWKSRQLMINALNRVSQSVYIDRGMFDIKTAETDAEKGETKELRDKIKAERYAVQVQALESYYEASESQIVEDIEDHELLSDQRMIALCVKICMNARIVKESAIDAILDMSKQRKISRKNVKEWIVKPATFMALRARAHGVKIDNEDAYRLLITRWKEGDEITNEDLIEWLETHEGRVLVKPDEDLDKRLKRARKLIKQAYGVKWSHGKFIIERLEPLGPEIKFDDTFPKRPKPARPAKPSDLVVRLRKLATDVPQEVETKLANQSQDWLKEAAQAVADRPNEIVMRFIGDDVINVGCAYAAQLASLIDKRDSAKKFGKNEVKVLEIIKKASEPLSASQIARKSGHNKKTRIKPNELQTILASLCDADLVASQKMKRTIKYSPIVK